MARHVDYLEELQIAIRFKHRCKPTHKESVFVEEKVRNGETAWKGYVEIFDLTGHKEAKICYAWLNHEVNGIKIVTILGNHFIDSPQKAVQAAIFVDVQNAFSAQLEQAKKTLQQTRVKTEDLDAAIDAANEIKERVQKRKIQP